MSKNLDVALQAFEAGSKTCNAKIAQKIVPEPMLHGIEFKRNIIALKICRCESSRVKHHLKFKVSFAMLFHFSVRSISYVAVSV